MALSAFHSLWRRRPCSAEQRERELLALRVVLPSSTR